VPEADAGVLMSGVVGCCVGVVGAVVAVGVRDVSLPPTAWLVVYCEIKVWRRGPGGVDPPRVCISIGEGGVS
jgi:hypothetical protein